MKRTLLTACAAVILGAAAAAAPAEAAQKLKHFQDWAVSHYHQHGKVICYAFTQALAMHHGGGGCDVAVLVVTHAPPRHDRVVVSPCDQYGAGQTALTMSVGDSHLGFEPRGKYAYADLPPAAVKAFRIGMEAKIPGPTGHTAETFSLRGFTAAYDALGRECVG
jgi:invasion protein IalB